MKKKIYFLAPSNKGGTYFYYKEISEYLIQNYSDIYEVKFCNTLLDYIKLHFIKSDIIFSIIPFVFKPLFTKKYIFNLHGNFKIERKNKGLGVKLLYLTELNLGFCDKIMLTSYYLADKLNFKKKYQNKIIIIGLFIKECNKNLNRLDKNKINILTVSSSNFLKKGLGIYELGKEIFKIEGSKVQWNIVLPGNKQNKEIILKKINGLKKNNNINLSIFNFLEKKDLNNLYKNSDIFAYASGLETWGLTIMEALSFGKPVILIKNDVWEYIYPDTFITNNFKQRYNYILDNYEEESIKSFEFVNKFKLEEIIKKLIKLI